MTRFALLFDLDGTLVDTDRLHHAAFAAVIAEATGGGLSLADYKAQVMGRPNVEIAGYLFPGHPEAEALIAEKEARFRASLAVETPPVAGTGALLDWAEAMGAGLAVVTNAPRANAETVLAAAGLERRFAEIVIGDECARPKPDPAPYREAMRRLGVTPARSVAFEDSRAGLRAARGSGARVFGLSTGLAADELLQAGAHQVIPDFTHPDLWGVLHSLRDRVA